MEAPHAVGIGVAAAFGGLFAFGCALLTDLDPLTESRDAPVDGATADSTIDGAGGDAPPGSDGEGPGSDGGTCDSGYREMVLADKPVAYWRLGEPPGEVRAIDESGNGNDGTYLGGIELAAPGAIACDPNHAIQNDGTGSVSIANQPDFSGTKPMTLEAWAAFGGGLPTFVGNAGYTLFWWGDGPRFDRHSSSSNCACPGYEGDGGAFVDGRYHHFVATYDSFTMKLYVDGVMARNCPCTLPLLEDAGAIVLGGNGFGGKLDEVAIYDKALPTQTIQKHFAARAP